MDAFDVVRGVVGLAQDDLAQRQLVDVDGDERLGGAGVAVDLVGRRRGAHGVAQDLALGIADEVPAEARDVALEARGRREAEALDFVECQRGREAQRRVGAGGALLDGLNDGEGGERGAGVAFDLGRRFRGWSPIAEGLGELRVVAELVDVRGGVLGGEDARADHAVMVVERDEDVARALIAEDSFGLGLRREQDAEFVLVLVADEERALGAGLNRHGVREERLRVVYRQVREGGVRRRRGQLQQPDGDA